MKEQTVTLWKVQLNTAIFCLKDAAFSNPRIRTLSKLTAGKLRALRPIIPYCALRAEKDDRFILLNRDYKPLGVANIGLAYYQQYPWAHCPPPPEAMIDPKNGGVYFFDDGCAPWNRLSGIERLIERLEKFLEVMMAYEQNT